jgi:general secretion pathway protein A
MHPSLAAILQRFDDPAFLHAGPGFTECVARLHFAIEHRFSVAALVGERGTGKSAVLRQLRRELISSPGAVVVLQITGLEPQELLAAVTEQLGVRPQWRELVLRLTELAYDQAPLIILADQAEHISPESLDFFARLLGAESTGQLQTTLIFALDELALAAWPDAWLQRVDLRAELPAWSLEDSTAYLTAAVGDERKRQRGFEPAAIQELHRLSRGLPGLLRRFARLSLLATEGQQRAIVDEATVIGACHELCGQLAHIDDELATVEFINE